MFPPVIKTSEAQTRSSLTVSETAHMLDLDVAEANFGSWAGHLKTMAARRAAMWHVCRRLNGLA
jgi:hypothetical protein